MWNENPGNDWSAWTSRTSNFGNVNLCTLTTNKFKALETKDEDNDEETTK